MDGVGKPLQLVGPLKLLLVIDASAALPAALGSAVRNSSVRFVNDSASVLRDREINHVQVKNGAHSKIYAKTD